MKRVSLVLIVVLVFGVVFGAVGERRKISDLGYEFWGNRTRDEKICFCIGYLMAFEAYTIMLVDAGVDKAIINRIHLSADSELLMGYIDRIYSDPGNQDLELWRVAYPLFNISKEALQWREAQGL